MDHVSRVWKPIASLNQNYIIAPPQHAGEGIFFVDMEAFVFGCNMYISLSMETEESVIFEFDEIRLVVHLYVRMNELIPRDRY